ncbi:hypothetical protein C7T94_10870 [Pedobacter yulinensis]|uniref:ATP synthase F0 sector subunit C n=1 Tax=Pedobacter yulinensis TaxID=2126353 RepID=A0A2T3HKY8_9SPHI|nr:hypothetical protein [Pedobacter yulinensis]PST83107.1 hypothetical protein C7T94_10870 [Pedobacter yulinensis]
MQKKRSVNFILLIIVIILGTTLYKQFDFGTFIFQQPAMAVVYGITFLACLFLLIKAYRGKQ